MPQANSLLRSVLHDRCPVVIPEGDLDVWMQGTADDAHRLLKPAPEDALRARRVSA